MYRTVDLRLGKRKSYNDVEVVNGLQQHTKKIEEWFYKAARMYFNQHFNDIFFDHDKKQEIFQSTFLKLWTEIDNGTISADLDGTIKRKRRNGEVLPMTCSLTTFLMTFAKNEYRELVRSQKFDYYDEIYETNPQADMQSVYEEDDEEKKRRIVDDCIQRISPRCIEILTMFYYEQKTLDEILAARQERHTSKNGLKTAKNKCMNTLRSLCSDEFKKYNI